MTIQEIVLEKAAKGLQLAIDPAVFQSYFNNKPMKIVWVRDANKALTLYARIAFDHGPVTQTGLRSGYLDPIQEWCVRNKCGTRTSFEMFRFRNEAEVSMFLLKWG